MVNEAGHDDDNAEEETATRVLAPCHEIKFPVKDERPKLFGRHKELKRLRSCYNDLMQSPSNKKGTVFVSGVQGVGKTALVEEFLFQPLERRRAAAAKMRGGGQRGGRNTSCAQQRSVVRCQFSKKQQDGYQSWDEVYFNLRDMAQNQAASVDDVACDGDSPDDNYDDSSKSSSSSSSSSSCSRSLLSDDDDSSIISASYCHSKAKLQKLDDIPTSTSRESIHSLLSIICHHNCKQQQQPLILFLDDCQNMTSMSLDVLSYLLSEESSLLGGLFLICAYSTTSDASGGTAAPFDEFLDQARSRVNNQILDSSMTSIEGGGLLYFGYDMDRAVEVINIYPLTLDVFTTFIAECCSREMNEVAALAEVIYDKTIGIIYYVRSAMNDLVAKNLLRYNSTTHKLSWIDDHFPLKGAVDNYLSCACIVDDVIHTIRSQIREQLSVEVQRVIVMMACMPNLVFRASMLCELLYLEESDVRGLLEQASNLLRISSSSTLTVTFAHDLIRQALRRAVPEEDRNELVVRVFDSHFRKWSEKRMHVGQRNRAPKLRTEMTALVAFFNVIDPLSSLNGHGSLGDLADSNVSRNSNVSASSDNSSGNREMRWAIPQSKSVGDTLNDGRRRRGGGRRGVATSDLHKSLSVGALEALTIQDCVKAPIAAADTRGNATFSEITTKNEAAPNPFARLIVGTLEPDPMPFQRCPARIQKQALENIFFPFVSDQKSVLMHHGSVYFYGNHPPTKVAVDDGECCNLKNERELMIFSHGFIVADFPVGDSYHLMMALTDGDIVTQDSLLEYLRAKLVNTAASGVSMKLLRDVFQEIAWPKFENVIRSLDPENNGQVKWGELRKELENMFSIPLSPIIKQEQRAQFASLFSSVARVDCLDVTHSSDPRSEAISRSSLAERSFAITLNDRDGDLIFTCSDRTHRDLFVSSLKSRTIKAIEKSSSPESIMMRKNRGWQHLVVRNSPISYVIDNDAERLANILDDSKKDGDDAFGEVRFKLSELDENGYAAIHYACFLGHARCVEILLQKAGSNASLLDGRGLSPIDLATSDEVIAALEKKRSDGDGETNQRPSLSRGKSGRPILSSTRKQSSFRRLRGVARPRRKVSFAEDLEESTRSLPLSLFYDSDSSVGEGAPPHTASMPNVWK